MPVNVALPKRVATRRLNLGRHFNAGERRITRTRRNATPESHERHYTSTRKHDHPHTYRSS